MQLISQSETLKETLEFAAELGKIEEKDKIMENSYTMFQIKEVLNFHRYLISKLIILKSDSHLPKILFYLLQGKPFKSDEKCF